MDWITIILRGLAVVAVWLGTWAFLVRKYG